MTNTPSRRILAVVGVVALAGGLGLTAAPASAAPASAAPATPASAKPAASGTAPLTNLAHLDFLLDSVAPASTAGHTTYRLGAEPTITMPWVYANANDDGSFTRVGGGDLDTATGHYGQGAFDSDDISRAAVVYLRDWQQTHSASARKKAYELLRATAYFQTTSGPDRGNVVLWMQSDGTLNATPTPADSPNPADSGASYWLARSLWAFGEGYAAFRHSDPKFAAFLSQRIHLGVSALNREVLNKYGRFAVADGTRVPSWLIVDGADASAEAVLGLTAYTAVQPRDSVVRSADAKLARGVALMGSGNSQQWPYGAILPWAESRSMWHAWSSQMPAALARASVALHDRSLLAPAVADSVSFTTTMLAADGPDNAWYPTPIDQTQIAYGADSRLQSLLAVADASHSAGIRQLAGIEAAWYFGMNKSGQQVYNPTTGVTIDGVQSDGSLSRNSGAESTIHGLLSMLALDSHPDVRRLALAAAHVSSRDGLVVSEAEAATSTTGAVVTPDSAWTGESQYSGGKFLSLAAGQTATIPVGAAAAGAAAESAAGEVRSVEPVIFRPAGVPTRSSWGDGTHALGLLSSAVGAMGITAVPGALLPQTLAHKTSAASVTVTATKGTLALDAIISRPALERLSLTGTGATELLHSTSLKSLRARIGATGKRMTVAIYDSRGRLVSRHTVGSAITIVLPAGGFAIATR
jgi:hypothetical protein